MGYSCVHGIPKVSKNAEQVIKFLNLYYDQKNFVNIYDGEEGKHWKMENNVMKPIMPIFGDERGNSYWYLVGTGPVLNDKYWRVRVWKNEVLGTQFDDIQKYGSAIVNDYSDIAPPINSVVSSKDKLTELKKEYFTKFIVGALSLDKYDDFLKLWDEAGGTQAETDLNAWFATSGFAK